MSIAVKLMSLNRGQSVMYHDSAGDVGNQLANAATLDPEKRRERDRLYNMAMDGYCFLYQKKVADKHYQYFAMRL